MLLQVVRIVCLISTGLYGGIIFGDRLGATYSRRLLQDSSFVLFQQTQHVHFRPVLMPLTITMLVSSLIWVALSSDQWRRIEFWSISVAAMLILVAFVATRIVNFPINDALMTWRDSAPPPNMRELWSSWESAHTLRAAVSVIAFVLQVIGANLQAGGL
jgi:uncharacterized membrane protein